MPTLEVENVSIRFGGILALDDVSFTVEEGAIVGLIGPNGAGKSTLFNCITRLYDPDAGRIRFGGQDLLTAAPHQIVRRGIARTFQNVELFKTLTVLDNLLIGQHSELKTGVFSAAVWFGRARNDERRGRERAREVLSFLGLAPYEDVIVAGLPYGVQKQVELGRALVSRPRLILLDEPAAGQNPHETASLAERIRQIRDTFGITVLLVEHDMLLVMGICEYIHVLDFGRRIASGTPREIQANPKVIEAYLGEAESAEDEQQVIEAFLEETEAGPGEH